MRRMVIFFLFCFPKMIYAAHLPLVNEYKLDNGLKLIVKEDHRAPVVFSSIWYKVGGSYEPRGITGVSHALEHMMFRGTTQYGPGKFSEMINSNGGEQNAMTSDDFTVYFQSLPVDKIALSFELEADRMTHLTLDKEAFAKEIQVVMEERRMRTEDNPQALTMERFNAIAFINNPYSHPVVGWMSDLEQMTVADLRDWYHQWYAPNNAVLIIVGDVKPEDVLVLAKKYFGKIPAKTLPPLKSIKEVSALGPRYLSVHIPAQLPWVTIGYNTPSLTADPQSIEPYALTVLAYLLGGGDSSRLSRDLVRGSQIAVSASANYDLYNLYNNLFILSATPAKQVSTEILQRALQKEIQNFQNNLVSPEELAKAKALLIASHVFDQDSLTTQALNLGLPEVTGLSFQKESEFVSRIEDVTAQQIRSVAKQYFIDEKLTVGILDPILTPNAPPNEGASHENSSAIH